MTLASDCLKLPQSLKGLCMVFAVHFTATTILLHVESELADVGIDMHVATLNCNTVQLMLCASMSLTSHAALLLKDKRLSAFSCIKQHSSVRMLHATSSLPVWASDLNKLGKLHANTVVIILRDMLDLQAEE